MSWFIFKQVFSIILLVILILFYFNINNRKIFIATAVMLVAFIPLRRLFSYINYDNEVHGLISKYPILDTIDYFLPFLIIAMTIIVLIKYKKNHT